MFVNDDGSGTVSASGCPSGGSHFTIGAGWSGTSQFIGKFSNCFFLIIMKMNRKDR
jgi:hypothetical protein